ncbi:hypothetical protein EDB85DRAFT_2158719 [Lactarius pseudohatsudake]|nr:hypothetical protein EDB85DRAFT_2158719 [Lactarius pseudohatsudake]
MEKTGMRPSLVPIFNTRSPFSGIISIRLPLRSGASPLDFSMTRFNKIKSPPTALLGDSIEAPRDACTAWWDTLWRIPSPTKTESSSPGDVLALCIRHGAGSPSAATPSPYSSRKDSLLAEHAHALLEEGRQALRRIPGGYRSETAEYALLPESERPIVALGHASAYSIRGEGWYSSTCTSALSATSPGVALPRVAPDIEKHFVGLNIKHAVRSDST